MWEVMSVGVLALFLMWEVMRVWVLALILVIGLRLLMLRWIVAGRSLPALFLIVLAGWTVLITVLW